ncbi:MAG: GNAT family N-acetyltransferase [Alphaproteobacteria bacterium]|nr:GNAT family N-acetyltransferase [Alphaproteobacteria bacterium]
MPGDITLTGRFGSLERTNAAQHGADLWDAVRGHIEIWDYMPAGPYADAASFTAYVKQCETSKERIFYSVLQPDGRAVGFLALMEIRPAHRVIEVGNIVYGAPLQRTPLGTEAQFMIARYAFETLGYRRYEWKCNALNAASRRAAERFGFVYEGTFRQHMIVKGRSRDTYWLSILDGEWPARKAAFERWLAPENFDSQGNQKKKLGEA